jgi:membrane protease YdiL (CAAX protease family)
MQNILTKHSKKIDLILKFIITFIAILLVSPIAVFLTENMPINGSIGEIFNITIIYLLYLVVMIISFRTKFKFNKEIFKITSSWIMLLLSGLLIFSLLHFFLNGKVEFFGNIYLYNLEFGINPFNIRLDFFFAIIIMYLIQTLAEEWIFRGWLISSLSDFFGSAWSVFISAVIFGWIHTPGATFSIPNFSITFGLGVVWGIITIWTGSFINTWPIHFFNNLFFTFILGYGGAHLSNLSFFKMENLPLNPLWVFIFFSINLAFAWRVNKISQQNKIDQALQS